MASPPPLGAGSPPNSQSGLALPRQRPTLALPKTGSRVNSAVQTPSALRQTSFPPEDSLEAQHALAEARRTDKRREVSDNDAARFSGDSSLDEFSDDADIQSAIGGDKAVGKKRERGQKRTRGRPPKYRVNSARQGSTSVVNGDDGKNRRGGTVGADDDADAEDEDDDEEDMGLGNAKDGFNVDMEEVEQERSRRYVFRESVHSVHQLRFDSFHRVKLKTPDVRKLINATLSQSVPPNVVNVVMAYTKTFAGMLIESAKEVQDEWMSVEEGMPDGRPGRAYKRLKMMQPMEEDENEDEDDEYSDDVEDEGMGNEQAVRPLEKEKNVSAEADKPVDGVDQQAEPDSNIDSVTRDSTQPKTNTDNSVNLVANANDVTRSEQQPNSPKNNITQANGTFESPTNTQGSQSTQLSLTQPNSSAATIPTQPLDQPASTNADTAAVTPALSNTTELASEQDPTNPSHIQPGAGNLAKYIDEPDRGPLLPDHLREALRRYRKGRTGGTVGFTGLSLEGKENAAVRMGGRKLFR